MTSFRLVEEGDILGGKLTHLDYEKSSYAPNVDYYNPYWAFKYLLLKEACLKLPTGSRGLNY